MPLVFVFVGILFWVMFGTVAAVLHLLRRALHHLAAGNVGRGGTVH